MTTEPAWLDQVKWNADGLVAAIAQESSSGQILMQAWMDREALVLTAKLGHAVYWSRSRQKLWHKGESSGHVQDVKEIRLDCDGDAVLLIVEQRGGIACHTGRHHCFFRRLEGEDWQIVEPVIRSAEEIYANDDSE